MTIHKKRLSFIDKMIEVKRGDYSRQVKYAKEIFSKFEHDFLLRLSPPNWWSRVGEDKSGGSLQWFTTSEGNKWLQLKQNEFFFKVENDLIEIDDSLDNEQVTIKHKKSLKQFLKD